MVTGNKNHNYRITYAVATPENLRHYTHTVYTQTLPELEFIYKFLIDHLDYMGGKHGVVASAQVGNGEDWHDLEGFDDDE